MRPLVFLLALGSSLSTPAPSEPYLPLHGFNSTALPARPASLDPLVLLPRTALSQRQSDWCLTFVEQVRYAWDESIDPSRLQTFLRRPRAVVSSKGQVDSIDSLLTARLGNTSPQPSIHCDNTASGLR